MLAELQMKNRQKGLTWLESHERASLKHELAMAKTGAHPAESMSPHFSSPAASKEIRGFASPPCDGFAFVGGVVGLFRKHYSILL